MNAIGPQGHLLGLDADTEAIAGVQTRLACFAGQTTLVQANFRDIGAVAATNGFSKVDTIPDLGVSSYQLWEGERGFSFTASGPLDMRMNPRSELTADEIVNTWPQDQLANTIYRYGEEPRSRRIARTIVAARPLHTTAELAEVIAKAIGGGFDRSRIHPATKSSGTQDRGQRRDRRLGGGPAEVAGVVGIRRAARSDYVSLFGRSPGQAVHAGEARDCLCPPTCRLAGVGIRRNCGSRPATHPAGRGRDRSQPTQPECKTPHCRAAVALAFSEERSPTTIGVRQERAT